MKIKYYKSKDGTAFASAAITDENLALQGVTEITQGELKKDEARQESVKQKYQSQALEIAATLAKDKAEAVAIAAKALGLSDAQAKALFG